MKKKTIVLAIVITAGAAYAATAMIANQPPPPARTIGEVFARISPRFADALAAYEEACGLQHTKCDRGAYESLLNAQANSLWPGVAATFDTNHTIHLDYAESLTYVRARMAHENNLGTCIPLLKYGVAPGPHIAVQLTGFDCRS